MFWLTNLFGGGQLTQARNARLPLIDRAGLAQDEALHACLLALREAAGSLSMPGPARQALEVLRHADAEDRSWLLANVLADTIPEDSVAPHLFAAAAVLVYLTRLASSLPLDALQPVATGVCPACGGRPVTSSVIGLRNIENVRNASLEPVADDVGSMGLDILMKNETSFKKGGFNPFLIGY